MSTATIAGSAGTWPLRRTLYAVLAVSLALNLLFVAGAVWSRTAQSPGRGLDQRLHRIGAQLDLDTQQRVDFDRFVDATRVRSEKARQQIADLYGAAWAEAGRPTAEAATVLRLFDEAFDRRRQLNRETIMQTLDFLATLLPEQRSRFVALAREKYRSRRNPPAVDR